MCDFSGKLIAWLDHELSQNEAACVEQHLRRCTECHRNLESYRQVSSAFDAYCDSVTAWAPSILDKVRRKAPRWVPVVSGAVAVAAAAAVLLAFLRAPLAQPPTHLGESVSNRASEVASRRPLTASAHEVAPALVNPLKNVHRRHPVAPVQNQNANWVLAEPAIQIAIPGEAIFPPGAVPEGVTFFADISIAADGSTQGVRLRP